MIFRSIMINTRLKKVVQHQYSIDPRLKATLLIGSIPQAVEEVQVSMGLLPLLEKRQIRIMPKASLNGRIHHVQVDREV